MKGTEAALQKKLIDAVMSAEMVPPGPGIGTMKHGSDHAIYYIIGHRDMADLLSSPGTEEDLMDWSSESYSFELAQEEWEGVEDFDEDSAVEYLEDELEHLFA
jgi:hypothetical protein